MRQELCLAVLAAAATLSLGMGGRRVEMGMDACRVHKLDFVVACANLLNPRAKATAGACLSRHLLTNRSSLHEAIQACHVLEIDFIRACARHIKRARYTDHPFYSAAHCLYNQLGY